MLRADRYGRLNDTEHTGGLDNFKQHKRFVSIVSMIVPEARTMQPICCRSIIGDMTESPSTRVVVYAEQVDEIGPAGSYAEDIVACWSTAYGDSVCEAMAR